MKSTLRELRDQTSSPAIRAVLTGLDERIRAAAAHVPHNLLAILLGSWHRKLSGESAARNSQSAIESAPLVRTGPGGDFTHDLSEAQLRGPARCHTDMEAAV